MASAKKKGARRTCEICGIKEAHSPNTMFFANFPLNENRCRKWVRVTGNESLSHLPLQKLNTAKYVCSLHFKPKDFAKSGKRLKKGAVPCLHLTAPPLNDDQLAHFPHHRLGTGSTKLHLFPHPVKDTCRFNTWVNAVGSDVASLDPQYIYKNRVICSDHFQDKYKTWTGRLSNVAVPTLLMPDTTTHRADHCYSTGNNNDSSQRLAENDAEPKIGVPPKSNHSRPTSDKSGSVVGRKQKSNDERKPINKYTYGIGIEDTPDVTTMVSEDNSTGIDITYDMSADDYVDFDEVTDSNEPVLSTLRSEKSADLSEPNVDEAECNEENVEYISDSEHSKSSETASDSEHKLDIGGRSSLHEGVVCNACRSPITGFRYTCLQCEDFDLCSQCEANESHAHHYVLRVPEPRPYVELQAVLSRLRAELEMVTMVSGADPSKVQNLLEDDEIKIEVKMEPDEVPDPLSAELLAPQLENHSEEHQRDCTLSLLTSLPLDESESSIYLDENQAVELFKQYTQHEQEHSATTLTQSQSINDDNLASTHVLQLPTGLPQDESDTVLYLDENQVLELLARSQFKGRKRPGPSLQPPLRGTRAKVVYSSRTNETVPLPHLEKKDDPRR